MYTTRTSMPTATFPPFETSYWDMPESGFTLYIALPDHPVLKLYLFTLLVALIVMLTSLKDSVRSLYARRLARPAAPKRTHSKRSTDEAPENQSATRTSEWASAQLLLEDVLPPPSPSPMPSLDPRRSQSQSRPHNPRMTQTLKRTRSFSAHVLENSTRPLVIAQRAVVNQFTTMGREVLRPMLTTRRRATQAAPAVPEFDTPTASSASASSDSARSSMDSTAAPSQGSSAASAASAPASNASRTSSGKKAGRFLAKTRIFAFTRTIVMPSSAPSTPERTKQSSGRTTPSVKGPRRTANKNGEPLRYARPARPEHQMTEVIFETRFESPVKGLFGGRKAKANKAGGSPTKKRTIQEGFGLMKSSVSLRRLFCSGETPAGAVGEVSGSEESFRSRRSSLSSATSGATSSMQSSVVFEGADGMLDAVPPTVPRAPTSSAVTSTCSRG